MTSAEFELLLDDVVAKLTDAARSGTATTSKEFENDVLAALRVVCRGSSEDAMPTFHQHAFPDIIVNGFGVEVKHTIKDSWLAVGNSIFEGMRDKDATAIYVVYGKMGGWPEVRWARYEDCVTHVRISHAPRFVIEMDRPAPFFNTIEIPYSDFSALSPEEKMGYVRRYARGRLRDGEQLWWLEDLEEQEHTLPMAVRVYRNLQDTEKRQMRAESTLLCPEVVQPGHKRGKYDKAGLYLITQHGVFAPQIRDLFSAGSVGARDGERGHKYIIAATKDIEPEMRQAAAELDSRLFKEYWEYECEPDERIAKWLEKADGYASDWIPSNELFTGD